jgi:hypothetical protein
MAIKVVHAFEPYAIPAGGTAARCHVLREKERNELLEFCVTSLPDCYITQAMLNGRMKETGKSASDTCSLPDIVTRDGPGAFVAQCKPTQPDFLQLPRYGELLAERRRLIAARLNQFLGVESKPTA